MKWKMVPVEATAEMIKAGDDGHYGIPPNWVWEEMFAVSPPYEPSAEDVERAAMAVHEYVDRLPTTSVIKPLLRSHRANIARAVLMTLEG